MTPERQAHFVDKFRAGGPESEAAFNDFFAELQRPMLTMCVQLTGNQDDAKDAVQEAFIAVHRQLPKFRGDSALSTWAFQIAIRIALRIRGFSQRREGLDAVRSAAHPQLSPEVEVVGRQIARDTARAFEQLTIEHRLVLSLFAVEELSHGEIARLLGVPEGTVWSRLHSARKKLHSLLQHHIGHL